MTPEQTLAKLSAVDSKLSDVEKQRDEYLAELNKLRLMQLTLDPDQFYTNFYCAIHTFSTEQTIKFRTILAKLHNHVDDFAKTLSDEELKKANARIQVEKSKFLIGEAEKYRQGSKVKKGRKPLSPEAKILKSFVNSMAGIYGQTQIIQTLKSLPMFAEWPEEKIQGALDELNAKRARDLEEKE